jgi:glycosyl hydrolase family 44
MVNVRMASSRRLIVAFIMTVGLLVLAGTALAKSAAIRSQAAQMAARASGRLGLLRESPGPPPSSVTITVNPTYVLRPISPLIYGVAHASPDELVALGARLNRWGGNPNTRYNWTLGYAWNAARDYEFRNYGAPDPAKPAPTDSASDVFIAGNRSVDVQTEFTIPAIGWVARDGNKQSRSIGVPRAGGPPLARGSTAIAGYDPTDNRERTSVPSFARKNAQFQDPPFVEDGAPVFQDEFVHHLVDRFGAADQAGVRYYAIDNEPDLWSSTHTDVHPVQLGYDDMLSMFLDYAGAVKDVDPTAQVLGPSVSGWTFYWYSALDQGNDAFHTRADRKAHGDMPFLPWWLDQVHKRDAQTGHRSLDVLDVHYYPQAAAVFSNAEDPQTRALRVRSTRSLWDPTYVDESWIGEPVDLIPRLRAWIDEYYPGTRLAVGEWNWGAEKSMSGALAVADVLGIFGREGVDMASYWTFPSPETPAGLAFSMYTHFDTEGDAFGDEAVGDSLDASADYVTSYASVDSATGDVVVIAINKRDDAPLPAKIRLDGVVGATGEIYQLVGGDGAVRDVGSSTSADSEFSIILPASSITLLHIRGQ